MVFVPKTRQNVVGSLEKRQAMYGGQQCGRKKTDLMNFWTWAKRSPKCRKHELAAFI